MIYKLKVILSLVSTALLVIASGGGYQPAQAVGHNPAVGSVGLKDTLTLLASQTSSLALATSMTVTPTVYSWAKTWGGAAASAQAKSIVVDGAGNTYVVGEFNGTVDFDPAGSNPSATIASNKGTVDAFLSKFDSTGSFQWVRTWGSGDPIGVPTCLSSSYSYSRDAANGVAVDGMGNVYVAGLYQSTVDFGSGYVYTSNASTCNNNIFVAKFAANGTTQWARTWGGTTGGEGYSVAVDKVRGYVYVEGDWSSNASVHSGQVDFNPGGTHDWHDNHGFYDAFLSKYDLNGNFQWADTWGGHGYDDGPGVVVDSSGSIYVGGMYGSTDINFDPAGGSGGLGHGHGTPTNDVVDMNVFLSKFDPSGAFQWVRTWGGLSTEDAGAVVAVDGANNVYIGGRFQCVNCNFNAGPTGTPVMLSSNGDRDAFISKYDSNGNFQWARTWGGSGWDSVGNLAVDKANNVFTAGFFVTTVDFNPNGGGDIRVSSGGRDVFLNKFDSGGNFQRVQTWGGSGDDLGLGVAVDGTGNLFVVGAFQNTVDFDPGSGVDGHIAAGIEGAFISKFLPSLKLWGAPGDRTIYLDWNLNITVPITSTWQISYTNGLGSFGTVADVLSSRAHTLSSLTNGTWYTVTLNATLNTVPILTDTVQVMPAKLVYLPLVQK